MKPALHIRFSHAVFGPGDPHQKALDSATSQGDLFVARNNADGGF